MPCFPSRARTIACAALLGCAGLNPPQPVAPLPATATGLPILLAPGPTVGILDDVIGRPLTVALQHDVRDALEEAGFKLVDTEQASGGLVATLSVKRAGAIHADLFIHGAEACGVRLDITEAGRLLTKAEPDVPCVSTSTYYGMLSKDAAIGMVNLTVRSSVFAAVAASWHAAPAPSVAPPVTATPPSPSADKPEERAQ